VTKLSVVPIAADAAEGNSSVQTVIKIAKRGLSVIVLSIPRSCLALGRWIRFWRDYDRSMQELVRLSDYELRDMGMNRSDISRIARDEALRRVQSGSRDSTSRE
jgi:uncharacterized protein YjiS (DUF1127 family)